MRENSKTIDALRYNLYKFHGYDPPQKSLCMNLKQMEVEKNVKVINDELLKHAKINPQDIIYIGGISDEFKQIVESISSISTLISVLKNNEATDKDIDECLGNSYLLFTLPDMMDLFLAVTVEAIFCNTDILNDCKNIPKHLYNLFEITVYKAIDNLKSHNKNDKIYTSNNCFTINTDRLEIGMVIKNYKELCALLNQAPTTGKAKQLQLEEFSRYFEWEKSGQKFIITDIYDTPLEKEDKRKKGNNSIYVQYIELILLQYLSKQKNGTRTFKKRDWWQLLGMVNSKYNKVSQKNLEKIDYTITPFEIKHFYQRCNKKLEQVLFSALNNLTNRKLISYELQTIIVDNDNNYFCADDNDKRRILEAERYILHNVMGYEKMIQVFCRFKQDEYFRMVNERLSELYDWNYYYKQIKIIYIQKNVLEAIPQTEVNLQKEILNQKIVDVLNADAEKKFETEKAKWDAHRNNLVWGEYKELNDYYTRKGNAWDIPDTYISAQRLLVDELVCIGHKKDKYLLPTFEEDDELNQIFNSFLC